eukprot:1152081-Pelagomonas_calceolata.AAC.3
MFNSAALWTRARASLFSRLLLSSQKEWTLAQAWMARFLRKQKKEGRKEKKTKQGGNPPSHQLRKRRPIIVAIPIGHLGGCVGPVWGAVRAA